MKLLSGDELRKVRLGRRELEINAAKTIGRYLLANQKDHIRGLIWNIIDKILSLGDTHPDQLDGFLTGSTNFAMWMHCDTRPCTGGLAEVRRRVASDRVAPPYTWLHVCSDVIRLFGELAEQGWVPASDQHWHIMAKKNALRAEPPYAKPEKSREGWGHRNRLNKGRDEISEEEAPFMPIPRERVSLRGVERFKFGDDSVIATLDWTFGLKEEGADISGTTTDSIAAMRWASGGQVNPVAQLIAIASMVPQGHHTIAECAWPLTRHGYMNYHIGFYETLTPGGGYAGLASTLKIHNGDARNKHVLVCRAMAKSDWRTWEQRSGRIIAPVKFLALHFDQPEEIAVYRRLAGIRGAYGFCVGGRPSLDSLTNFVHTHGGTQQIIDRMLSKYHMA